MNIKDVVLQFLIIDEQEKMGVMPMLNSHAAMRNHVDSLSPEDAQKLKRKFRKVWRRLVKERCGDYQNLAAALYGKGCSHPTPHIMSERRELVFKLALERARERQRNISKA